MTLKQKILLPFYVLMRILQVLCYIAIAGPVWDFFIMVRWTFHEGRSRYDVYLFEFIGGIKFKD